MPPRVAHIPYTYTVYHIPPPQTPTHPLPPQHQHPFLKRQEEEEEENPLHPPKLTSNTAYTDTPASTGPRN